ncbi:DUF2058 domain-containing protein, partial [Pseudomonas aeruginosa]
RDPRRVGRLNLPRQAPDEDDPHTDYVVPADLLW